LMLSFSSCINFAKDCLLINSVKAASYIISIGVSCGFCSKVDQFYFYKATD
jgi:hypothetical protein